MRLRSVTALAACALVLVPGTAYAWNGSMLVVTAAGAARPYARDAAAVTYDPTLAPVGAQLATVAMSGARFTTVLLSVQGLLPSRGYGAHVHTKPCGPTPADAGPHFQYAPDPVQPSVDPVYANPRNEVWLDFTTDPVGNAVVFAKVSWGFGARSAGSIVLHESRTHTDPGHAGTAGARVACLSVPF